MSEAASLLLRALPHTMRKIRRWRLSPAARWIAVGDAARDNSDWSGAAKAYERALTASNTLAHIWVQLGHARKESGNLDGAEEAYRTALKLEPHNADSHLQLGHLLKMTARTSEAISSFRDAVETAEGSPDALRELTALAISDRHPAPRIGESVAQHAFGEFTNGPFVCDVTAYWRAKHDGREPSLPADRDWRLALGLQALGLAAPAIQATDEGRYRTLRIQSARPDRDPAKASFELGDDCATGTVILTTIGDSLETPNSALSLRVAAQKHGYAVVLLFPDLLPGQEGSAETYALAWQRAADASQIYVGDFEAAREWRRRLTEIGRHPEIRILRFPTIATSPAAQTAVARRVVCLRPELEAEALAILAGVSEAGPDYEIVMTTGLADAREASDGPALERLRSDPDVVLLAPASRSDATLWIEAAESRGIPIAVSTRAASRSTAWPPASTVNYVDTFEPAAVTRWLESPQRRGPGRAMMAAMIEALAQEIGSGFTANGGVRRWSPPHAIVGRFYGFRRAATPTPNQSDALIQTYGGETDQRKFEPRRLVFAITRPRQDEHRISVLVERRGDGDARLVARAGTITRTSRVDDLKTWQWITFVMPRQGQDGRPLAVEIELEGPAPTVVIHGFVVYPRHQDRLWFEFLDRASRGEIPEIGPCLWTGTSQIELAAMNVPDRASAIGDA